MITLEVFLVLCLFLTPGIVGAYYNKVLPSYGDILIYNTDVIVSLARDEKENSSRMAYICADDLHDYTSLGRVVSRQLGYLDTACTVARKAIDYSNTLIKKGLQCNCTGAESHILRCKCNVPQVQDSSETCQHKLITTGPCKNDESLFKLGNQGNRAYHGQVLLFPPGIDSNSFGVYSPSMGLVAVKKEGNCDDWKFVSKDRYSVDHSIATTFCRQMGYTDVVSASTMTRHDYEEEFSVSFSYWDSLINDPYLMLSNITCKSVDTCLACCKYPRDVDCKDPGRVPSSYDNILVIRCTFYWEQHVEPSGNNESCHFTNGKNDKICNNIISLETPKFIAAIAVPNCVLVLIIIGLILCLCCKKRCCIGCKARNGYDEIKAEE